MSISVHCNDRKAWLGESETLTAGGLGQTVEFTFSDDWNGLQKYAVFVAYDKSATIPMTQDEAAIPPDVLALPGICLFVGVYGTNLAGTTIIPTKFCNLGMIHPAANPSTTDNYSEPTAALMAQLLALTKAAQLAASIAVGSAVIDPTDEDGPAFSIQDHKKLILTVPVEGDDPTVIDIGTVTAYGAACEETGYSETYNQFKAKMAAAYSYETRLTTIESALDALDGRLEAVEDFVEDMGGGDSGEDPDPTPAPPEKTRITSSMQAFESSKTITHAAILTTSTIELEPKPGATAEEKNNFYYAGLRAGSPTTGSVVIYPSRTITVPIYFAVIVKNAASS